MFVKKKAYSLSKIMALNLMRSGISFIRKPKKTMPLRLDPKDIKAIAPAYFYRRSNLSDFALGVDNHLVGYSIDLREILGHQDDGEIIIPSDLFEKLSHLQSQGVIRGRKGLIEK